MPPKDQKILKTIELLMMLSRSKQQFSHGLTEEEKVTLHISRQVLSDSALTVPELTNSLQNLSKRGYTWHITIFDEHFRSQAKQFIDSEQFPDAIEKISKELDNKETSEKLNKTIVEEFKKIKPPNINISLDDDKKELPKTTDLLKDGLGVLNKMRSDQIALVILMPFRDINTLYEKMNKGMRFELVQDTDIWYDHGKKILHVGTAEFLTQYRGTTSRTHFILSSLFKNLNKELTIDFSTVEEFDEIHNGNKKHYDSIHNFVKKNDKLKDIFEIYTDRISINLKYKDDVH